MARARLSQALPVLALLLVATISGCGADGDSVPPAAPELTKTSAASTTTPLPAATTSTSIPTRTETPSTTPTVNTPASTPKAVNPAVACAQRKGNAGEIYVWNSYGSDQPPDAMRLGAGYVWDFGDRKCVTSTEFALTTNPGLPGFCTKVAKVSTNPGYRVDERPAPRLKHVIGQSGDC